MNDIFKKLEVPGSKMLVIVRNRAISKRTKFMDGGQLEMNFNEQSTTLEDSESN